MNYIKIGTIVNTHGIKGELRILSKFEFKKRVFIPNTKIYIGEKHIEETINTYRPHKMFDMVTLKNYNNINEVLKFKNEFVYIDKEILNLDASEYLETDIIGLNIIEKNQIIGGIIDIYETGKNHKVLEAVINDKKALIPYQKEFIKKIDLDNNTIELNLIEGLII